VIGAGDRETEDYPTDLLAFEKRFATEEQCREYLRRIRWPNGVVCPQCGSEKVWRTKRGLWCCAACRRHTSVTAGTIFEGSRKPLRLWFHVMWLVTSQKNGASALNIQRLLGLKRYETAWIWLHKLRRAMVRPGRDRLRGRVEVDETYLGGVEGDVHGRQTETKSIVVVAAEENGKGIGRIRLRKVNDASADSLIGFIREAVEPGSTVRTDGWPGYDALSQFGFVHKVKTVTGSKKQAHELMPRVHRVASLLDRWVLGTHQGAPQSRYLDYYLDEFTFRFNRRGSNHRGKLFYRLMQQAANVSPVSWEELTARRIRRRRAHTAH
jgi:transposase-like protein